MDKDIKESREYRLAKDWEMAVNNYQWPTERQNFRKAMGVHDVNPISVLTA